MSETAPETVIATTSEAAKAETAKIEAIKTANLVAKINTSEPLASKSEASLATKIKNEIIISQNLENLNVQTSSMMKAFINSFLRERSKEFKQWQAVGEDIKNLPVTDEGRLRLKIKHELMEERVLPSSSILKMTILPIVAYWLLKKGLTYLISSRVEAYQKTQTRLKKRAGQAKEKQERRASKGLPDKPAKTSKAQPGRRKR